MYSAPLQIQYIGKYGTGSKYIQIHNVKLQAIELMGFIDFERDLKLCMRPLRTMRRTDLFRAYQDTDPLNKLSSTQCATQDEWFLPANNHHRALIAAAIVPSSLPSH